MTRSDKLPVVLGIIPAAGMSRRMGIAKQTLPLAGYTMTACVARTMLDADLYGVVVVTRSELLERLALPTDDRLFTAINDDSNTQMLDSIQIGIRHLQEHVPSSVDNAIAGVLVIPGDMPTVPVAACKSCVEAFRRDTTRIVIATYDDKRGHPILFSLNLCESFGELKGGLNALPARFSDRVVEVACSDPAILRDVDTRADYEDLCE
jgi:molybdenum cofactor cytidylyltransferase